MATTRLSAKGQVVIPKPVRDGHGWRAGLELEVEEVGDTVVLRPARRSPSGSVARLRGCAGYRGPARSLEEMEDAIRRGVEEEG